VRLFLSDQPKYNSTHARIESESRKTKLEMEKKSQRFTQRFQWNANAEMLTNIIDMNTFSLRAIAEPGRGAGANDTQLVQSKH
jgi:hypothetical protein